MTASTRDHPASPSPSADASLPLVAVPRLTRSERSCYARPHLREGCAPCLAGRCAGHACGEACMVNETTLLGPGGRAFPDTPWSSILARAREGRSLDAAAWERLAHLYWRPIYFWFRWRWNRSTEDAKDLTQDLFSRLMRSEAAETLDPARGRLRLYLKACADNVARQQARNARRQKRGGGRAMLPLDEIDESRFPVPASPDACASLYDAEWAKSVVHRALETLRERLRQAGKEDYADLLEHYDLAEGDTPTYEASAARFRLTVDQVRNHLRYARSLLRAIVREMLRPLVQDPADVEGEYRDLFGAE